MKTVTRNDAAIQKQFLDFMQVDVRPIVSAEMLCIRFHMGAYVTDDWDASKVKDV